MTHIISVSPIWGKHYNVGYAGFTYNDKSVLSSGIALFTTLKAKLKVSHMIIVYDEEYCISADYNGVEKKKLSDYFENENCLIFFRKPLIYNKEIGQHVAEKAAERVGEKYDFSGLFAFIPRILIPIQRFFFKSFLKKKSFLSSKNSWFCSELSLNAYLTLSVCRYSWLLSTYHPSKISPALAFYGGDRYPKLWDPWKQININ